MRCSLGLVLRIRSEQMAAFRSSRERVFARWLLGYLREHDEGVIRPWSDAEVLRRIVLALPRARRHGVSDPVALADFFVAMVTHGFDFDQHPAVRAILADPALPADARVHAIWKRTTPATWAEIASRADPRHWGTAEEAPDHED